MLALNHLARPLVLVGVLIPSVQLPTSWQDPSPHTIQFVETEDKVRLEVLDWGGSGRPVVLLAGGGNTAHVFDEFAPKLTANFRVYALTRRGFGVSGFAASERGGDRLGEDVLAVINALKLNQPVLVGHSIAGAELSWVATSYPDRLGGLVYLEAGYPYAFDNGKGSTMKEFLEARVPQPPTPGDADLASFSALQAWGERAYGFRIPEAEFWQIWDSTASGRPVGARSFSGSSALEAILTAAKKYTSFPVPALLIFAIPHVPEPWMAGNSDPAARKAADGYLATIDAVAEKHAKALEENVPAARVVRMRGTHCLFLSNEGEVLREMRAFLDSLK